MGKNKKGVGKFLLGIGAGIGIGMLFAPDKGTVTRKKLKLKLDELLEKAKDIDVEDVKEEIEIKVTEIKAELQDLDKEKVLKIAKEKSEELSKKIEELAKIAKKKATPAVEKIVEEVRLKAIDVTKDVLTKLEKPTKEAK